MDSLFARSSFRLSTWSSRARAALASASLLLAVGCSEAGGGEDVDSTTPGAVLPVGDSGTFVPPSPVLDASVPAPVTDSGVRPPVTPTPPATTSDAGPINTGTGDAGVKDAGLTFPDLGTLFPPASDAGTTTPSTDSGVKPGGRDPNGPCKDLNLICFDFIDMFLFNAECSTCNGGKGCQGCAIPYAY
jgi:hypothetical protein